MSETPNQNPGDVSPKLAHAFELIFALGEDQITPEQFRALDSLVCTDPEIAEFYVDIMQLKSSLRRFSSYLGSSVAPDGAPQGLSVEKAGIDPRRPTMDESMVLPALSEVDNERNDAFGEFFQPTSALSATPPQAANPFFMNLKRGLAAVLVLACGLMAYLMLSNRTVNTPKANVASVNSQENPATNSVEPAPAPPVVVATLNYTQQPVWSVASKPPQNGKFYAGESIGLESGDVQLSFETGGRLVVEGPAEVEFVSAHKISLHRGKIAATIPGGGMVVDCPDGSVTDLGTQFGIEVNSHGATEVAVFEGRVSASLNSTATTQASKPMLLSEGQAAVMSPGFLSLDKTGAMPQRFVRSLVNSDINSLDLTDLICGGDGTTHRRGIGIDASTGMAGNLRPVFALTSDGKYHRINGYPFLDGAFISDASKGAMIVDSVGDKFQFSGLGATAYNCIFTGGKIPWPEQPAPDTVLNGIDYSTPDHSIVCIHPNNAFTLDLNAVRRIYPDLALKGFHCRVGISGTPNPKEKKIPDAAVLVLADGSLRFQNPHFTIFDGTFEINVPIKETDRFMTLASTYAGPGNYRNWVLWVDAKLDVSAGQ